ncbi:DeoR/GlpR transcriptional regulator [Verminephrobacter sp. Larva24]|nr:DeoR/GlpR transcriptional regulator [Verminephrobacter sp. Larva24]
MRPQTSRWARQTPYPIARGTHEHRQKTLRDIADRCCPVVDQFHRRRQGPARAAPTIDTMRPSERHAAILEIVDEHRHVSVDFLAQRFGASRETIRRDLTRLARDGRLRKYHGGATGAGALTEDAFSTRIHEFAREKRAVGRRAAAPRPARPPRGPGFRTLRHGIRRRSERPGCGPARAPGAG